MEQKDRREIAEMAGFVLFLVLFSMLDTPAGANNLIYPGCYFIPLAIMGAAFLFKSPPPKVSAGLSGAALVSGMALYHIGTTPCRVIALFLIAPGVVLGLSCWISLILSRFGNRAPVVIAEAFLISSIISTCLLLIKGSLASLLVQIVLVAASEPILLRGLANGLYPANEALAKADKTTIVEAFLCVASLSFATAVLHATAIAGSSSFDQGSQLLTMGGLLGALLWLALVRSTKIADTKAAFLVLHLIAIAEFAFIVPFGIQHFGVFAFIGGAGFKIAFLLAITTIASAARSYGKLLPLICFALASMYFFVEAGMLLGSYSFSNIGFGFTGMLAVALPVVVVISSSSIILSLISQRKTAGERHEPQEQAHETVSHSPVLSKTVDLPPTQAKAIDLENLKTTYGLTVRETEVLEYLMSGRSVPYISSALVVSESTVKSHVKSLYRKCGVHGRQELLDEVSKATSKK